MSGLGRARGRVAVLSVSFVSFLAFLVQAVQWRRHLRPAQPLLRPPPHPRHRAGSPDQPSAESEALAEAEQSKQPAVRRLGGYWTDSGKLVTFWD